MSQEEGSSSLMKQSKVSVLGRKPCYWSKHRERKVSLIHKRSVVHLEWVWSAPVSHNVQCR